MGQMSEEGGDKMSDAQGLGGGGGGGARRSVGNLSAVR